MNFRLSRLKGIVSLILSIIVAYLFATFGAVCYGECPKILWLSYFIVSFFISFIIIYFIWSLFEKRDKEYLDLRSYNRSFESKGPKRSTSRVRTNRQESRPLNRGGYIQINRPVNRYANRQVNKPEDKQESKEEAKPGIFKGFFD